MHPPPPRRQASARSLRVALALLTATIAATSFPAIAAADGTDDYPIPHRMIVTTCTTARTTSTR